MALKMTISSLWRRPFVGVLLVLLVLLSVASIMAIQSTVVEAGHERSAPHAMWLFLALLAVTSVVAVLAVLTAMRSPMGTANDAVAAGIRWGSAIAAGMRPLTLAALYPWLFEIVALDRMPALKFLFDVGWYVGRPAEVIMYTLTGSSLGDTDWLPRGVVEFWLLTGLVSVTLWSTVGMLLLAGARRVHNLRNRPPKKNANRI